MTMNKVIFDQQWKVIRGEFAARWSLVGDFDLNRMDKAEDKYHRFVTMLQVKYGFTRQQAREEIGKFWTEFKAGQTD